MEVAVKVLRRSALEMNGDSAIEFEREVAFMQRMRHTNLVRFFGAGRNDDWTPFLVEELMPGGTLKGLLRGSDCKVLFWDLKVSLVADVARGISYIHQQGHIHRDLKSDNVLITETLQAKVADFGSVGRSLKEAAEEPARSSSSHSRHSISRVPQAKELEMTQGVGTPLWVCVQCKQPDPQCFAPTFILLTLCVCSSPRYMSLEMLQCAGYDASTDVWSFGVLMWEVAAQAAPDLLQQEGYTKGPVFSALLGYLEDGRRLAVSPEWPVSWQMIIAQCHRRHSADRPSFATILRDLEVNEQDQAGASVT